MTKPITIYNGIDRMFVGELDSWTEYADGHVKIQVHPSQPEPVPVPQPEPTPQPWKPQVIDVGMREQVAFGWNNELNGVGAIVNSFDLSGGMANCLLIRQGPGRDPAKRVTVENTLLSDFAAQGLFAENFKEIIIDGLVVNGFNENRDPLRWLDHLLYLTISNLKLKGVDITVRNSLLYGGWYGAKIRGQHTDAIGDVRFENTIFADFVEGIGAKPDRLNPKPQRRIIADGCVFAWTQMWRDRMVANDHNLKGYNALVRGYSADLVDISTSHSIGTLRGVNEMSAIKGDIIKRVVATTRDHHNWTPLDDGWIDRFANAEPPDVPGMLEKLRGLV